MGRVTMGRVTMGQVTMGQVTMGQVTMGQVTMGQVTMGQVTMGHTPYGFHNIEAQTYRNSYLDDLMALSIFGNREELRRKRVSLVNFSC
jgi:hypothetical protein